MDVERLVVGMIIRERYRLDAKLGRGGMGVVYQARDLLLERDVAIKVLDLAALSQDAEMFLREARAAARLNHPHIASIHDAGQEEGQPYIIMELVRGEPLDPVQPRPLEEIVRIGRQVCEALQHAHEQGIVHCDLKPDNVLVTAGGTIRLVDFGLAQLATSRLAQEGSFRGTITYVSPEQAMGKAVDGRADLYSLGVMLYELAAGRPPFVAGDPVTVLLDHVNKIPEPPSQYNATIEPALEALVLSLLRKEPAARPASAAVVGQALAELVGPAVSGRPVGEERRYKLPVPPTPFIGRQKEVVEVSGLLRDDPACRLLTLLGPGGMGKTRLAIEVAGRLQEGFGNGACFVSLAPLTAADSLVVAINEALQFSPVGAKTTAEIQEKLLDFLSRQQLLLVMDNFEHLVEQSELMAEILAAAPEVKILATSREVLNLVEEWSYPVDSLLVPEDEEAEDFEAYSSVQLFVQSARRVRPGFAAGPERACIVEICRLVEGMPLGIELAAAWLRQLSCATIAAEIGQNFDFLATRLRNMTVRHRSLRAVFDYSWNLLDEEEREVLSRLAVFHGGFSQQAAAEVAGARLAHLSNLEDKSLLRTAGDGRYDMHELVRHYAAEKLGLAAGEQQESFERHCDFFARFMVEQEKPSHETGRPVAVGEELENVRHALHWAMAEPKAEQIGQIIGSLAAVYGWQGRYLEAFEMLEQVVQVLQSLAVSQVLAKALAYQGRMSLFLGRYDAAEAHLLQSLSLQNQEQDPFLMAWTQSSIAMTCGWLGKSDEANYYHQHALTSAKTIGASRLIAEINNSLGASAYNAGQYIKAGQYFRICLETYQALDDRRNQAGAFLNLADVSLLLGEYEEAEQLLEQCLDTCGETNYRYIMAMAYSTLGEIYRIRGDHEQAKQQLEESLAIHNQFNNQAGVMGILNGLGTIALEVSDYKTAQEYFTKSLSTAENTGSPRFMAIALHHLAELLIRQSRDREARNYLLEALQLADETNNTPLILKILVNVADLLGRDQNAIMAIRLLSLVVIHPAAGQATKKEADDLLKRWKLAPLPEAGLSPADLEHIVKEAIDWLLAAVGL